MAQSAPANDDPVRLWVIEWCYPEEPVGFDPIWFTIGDAIKLLRGVGIEPPNGVNEYNEDGSWHLFEGWDRHTPRIEAHVRALGEAFRPYRIARDEAMAAVNRLDLCWLEPAMLPLPGTDPLLDGHGRSCGAFWLLAARESDRDAVEKMFPHREDRFEDWQSRASFEWHEIKLDEKAYETLIEHCCRVWLGREEADPVMRYAKQLYGRFVPGKNTSELLSRVHGHVLKSDLLARVSAAAVRLGWNWPSVARYLESKDRPAPRIEFAVDRLLLRQAVSILVGAPGIGKSTVALQIALDVALGRSVLGTMTVPPSDGLVIYFSGEDTEAVLSERLDQMLAGAVFPERLIFNCQSGPIDRLLAAYDGADVSLVIIDTAARYTQGSVSDGGHVRAFLGPIDDFAKRTNCAVLIIHHVNKPGKSGPPRNAEAVRASMKGSGEFYSAPRVFIAWFEAGADRVLQVAKANVLPTTPMQREPLRLSYDRATGLHAPTLDQALPVRARPAAARRAGDQRPVPGDPAPSATQSIDIDADARAVANVVLAAIAAGRKAPRTGAGEPHTWGEASLAGWPRKRVRAAHSRALDMGFLDSPTALPTALGGPENDAGGVS
ncbi:MAG: AAA family ATPase [Azospirillum sp.]|nr:AAA family ATPase [Azospirillum sp.]MCA3266934.1 AAA family ATPase [Azospirillum sp.]MCZ8123607.1 AAA family ATPase [Magnetospirillum sp.]